ncbi:MAG: histidine phosphatase family protein [Leptospirales bacterium]|nr:histidine phosphatase family protein [Leptospirales bacterium]
MKILFVRHAIAADREDFPGDDMLRPLTDRGKKRARRAFHGLRRIYSSIDLVYVSPALRARQTGRILKRFYDSATFIETPLLSPDQADFPAIDELMRKTPAETIAIVGHEPNLTQLAAFLLRVETLPFELAKAGVLVLDIDETRVQMESLLTARILRRLYG